MLIFLLRFLLQHIVGQIVASIDAQTILLIDGRGLVKMGVVNIDPKRPYARARLHGAICA